MEKELNPKGAGAFHSVFSSMFVFTNSEFADLSKKGPWYWGQFPNEGSVEIRMRKRYLHIATFFSPKTIEQGPN
jgi:hypothetical protein